MEPIEAQRAGERERLIVERLGQEQHGRAGRPAAAEPAIPSKQDTFFVRGPREQYVVGDACFGKRGVVTRGTQPARKSGEHFVAQQSHACEIGSKRAKRCIYRGSTFSPVMRNVPATPAAPVSGCPPPTQTR